MPSSANFDYIDTDIQYSEGAWGEENSYRVVRQVTKKNGTVWTLNADVAAAVTEQVIPRQGQELIPATTGVTQRASRGMRCTGWSYVVDPTFKRLTFSLTFTGISFVDQFSTSPDVVFPSSTSYQSVTRLAKVYRRSWTSNPPTTSDASSNIGGTAVGDSGATITMHVPQVRMRVSLTYSAAITDMVTATQNVIGFTGKINSQPFAGFPIGTVICEGVNVQQTKMPRYEVIADFLYDDWAHHEQVPTNGADGRPNWSGSNLAEVRWVRSTRVSDNFNNLFADTAQRDRTLKGWLQ